MFSDLVTQAREWFEDTRVQSILVKSANEALLCDPHASGSGPYLAGETVLLHSYGYAIPKGGSGQLSNSLVCCIRANGGEVFTQTTVARILVRNGTAVGVLTHDGTQIFSKLAVICDVNIQQMPNLVGEENLESRTISQIERIRHSYSSCQVETVIEGYPKYSSHPELQESMIVIVAESLEQVEKTFDGIRDGIPQFEQPSVLIPSLIDNSRAPVGVNTLTMWLPEPYRLKNGGAEAWHEVKDELAWNAIDNLQRYCPNLTRDKIRYLVCHSPLDYERWNPSFVEGDPFHIASIIGQTGSLRPIPAFGNFKTPIHRLYMCGPSTHSGGVTGQSRAAVKAITCYLGYDFDHLLNRRHPP